MFLLLACCLVIALPAGAQGAGLSGTVTGAVVNVRQGPGTNYGVLAQVTRGARLSLTGRNRAGDWWQACCVSGRAGWIYTTLVVVEGDPAGLPIVAPSPPPVQPTPPPPTPTGGRGEYYANRDLQGAPALVRVDPEINFRWGGNSPGANLPGSGFSVRWSRTVNFEAGDYQFFAQVDDGVRLYLDGILLIDQWHDGSVATYSNVFSGLGAGNHRITVEYYQATGDSVAIVWWQRANEFPQWKGEYFNDIYLQGPPLLVRNDPKIDFNWDLGSPDPRVPADNFSVRWTRQVNFESGHYDFYATTSDGVRLYLDGWKVLDEWHDTVGYPTYTGRFYELSAGAHTLTVEYYERGGIAYAMVYWSRLEGGSIPQ
jgi:hypothetical protein